MRRSLLWGIKIFSLQRYIKEIEMPNVIVSLFKKSIIIGIDMKYKDLQSFFCERMSDLFDWGVSYSYKVKCLNSFSSMKEVRDVLSGWINGNVQTFSTVTFTIKEAIERIKKDKVLDFSCYSKDLFLDDLENLSLNGEKKRDLCMSSLYTLEKCIDANSDVYLSNIYAKIWDILSDDGDLEDATFKPIADELDILCNALACELLNEGFSHRHLYNKFTKLNTNIKQFLQNFKIFQEKHNHYVDPRKYDVYFKINGLYSGRLISIPGFYDSINDKISLDESDHAMVNRFCMNKGGWIYYYCEVYAHDAVAAIGKAKEKLDYILDKVSLGYSKLDVNIYSYALVISEYEDCVVKLTRSITVLDISYADDDDVAKNMLAITEKITEDPNINSGVRERIRASIRHLRMANMETDDGQKLVNYWIALEFIFSSPKASESTILRLENNLINILLSGYSKKGLDYLNSMCWKNGTLDRGKQLWQLDEDGLNTLIHSQPRLVDRYYIQDMKSNLLNKREDAKTFVTNHREHLKWHIYRIYRYRNLLVHEAAILPGIDNITRCLRYYLVYTLNQLLGYMTDSSNLEKTIDNFFYEYQLKQNRIDNILKKSGIGRDAWLDVLSNVKVYQEMMKTCE